MYEAHAWFGLGETPLEFDAGGLAGAVDELGELIARFDVATGAARIDWLNGTAWLTVSVSANRRRDEAALIDEVLDFLGRRLPGSWGLVYDRDDEMAAPFSPNEFRVRRFARGLVDEPSDPFLSPNRPTIED